MTRTEAIARIRSIESIVMTAMGAGDCVTAPHAFRVARTQARILAAHTNDEGILDALRNIETVCSMGIK
jgi:hypothetical protein